VKPALLKAFRGTQPAKVTFKVGNAGHADIVQLHWGVTILFPCAFQTVIDPLDVDIGESPAGLALRAMAAFHALVAEGD
jgi:hypothetical protein